MQPSLLQYVLGATENGVGLGTRLVKLKLFCYMPRDNWSQLADKGIPQVVAPCTVYHYTVHCTTVYMH